MHDFKPESLGGGTVGDKLPCNPGPPFIYAHPRGQYHFLKDGDGGGEWLPRVKKLKLDPGANGVTGSYRHPNFTRFTAWLAEIGYEIIMPDVSVCWHEDGKLVEGDNYLYSLECRNPKNGIEGKVYTDVWDNPVPVGTGRKATVDWSTHRDNAGFNAWCRMLMDDGRIQRPTQAQVSAPMQLQRRRAQRHAPKAASDSYHAQVLRDESTRYAGMLAAAKELSDPTPKRKGRGKLRKRQPEALDMAEHKAIDKVKKPPVKRKAKKPAAQPNG